MVQITEGQLVTKPLLLAQIRWCILLGRQCHMVNRASTTGGTEEEAGTKVPSVGKEACSRHCQSLLLVPI